MEQTAPTPQINKTAQEFHGTDLEKIQHILEWIKENFKYDPQFAKKRSRTADQIIQSKIVTGCIDNALVFIALTIVKNLSN